MSASTATLLKHALPLIRNYGFTREALAHSVLEMDASRSHTEPLSESAISALFGRGDEARRTLINAWLDQGISDMKVTTSPNTSLSATSSQATGAHRYPSVRDALHTRLRYNEPVLQYVPEAYAVLASPSSGVPPLDLLPALRHNVRIADEACYVGRDTSKLWYTRRASLAAIYGAAELHQLTSPETAHAFLDTLLDGSSTIKQSLDDAGLFTEYFFKSWKGIIKSSGVLG
ncbi:hypothetical protein BDN72DRAFT_839260 [Pluteus cervinus]|uniref:Uncharacterized protein n=1 Tax=Pluteus cervinus TaxID=181527 RepID=A0ACD3AWF4_9AGAR|nr:hypothetical protein BDN72DRAFT_839260 [Pluteus cervinus]